MKEQWGMTPECEQWIAECHEYWIYHTKLYECFVADVVTNEDCIQDEDIKTRLEIIGKMIVHDYNVQNKPDELKDTFNFSLRYFHTKPKDLLKPDLENDLYQKWMEEWSTCMVDIPPEVDSSDSEEEDNDYEEPKVLLHVKLIDTKRLEELTSKCWNDVYNRGDEPTRFTGKCGTCLHYHIHPKCTFCKISRTQAGNCTSCGRKSSNDDQYLGLCATCNRVHMYPTCIECGGYREQPGRCQLCGTIGPDDQEPTGVTECIYTDPDYEDEYLRRQKVFKQLLDDPNTQERCIFCTKSGHGLTACLYRLNAQKPKKIFDIVKQKTFAEYKKNNRTFPYPGTVGITPLNLRRSLLKIIPDGMELPLELSFHEECVWCGSKGHSTLDCQAYYKWAEECVTLVTNDDPNIIYNLLQELPRNMEENYESHQPWQLYLNLPDGEYLTPTGVKIVVYDKKIQNLIPRYHQSSTTPYASLPSAIELSNLTKLSSKVKKLDNPMCDAIFNQFTHLEDKVDELHQYTNIEFEHFQLDHISIKEDIKANLDTVANQLRARANEDHQMIMEILKEMTNLPKQIIELQKYMNLVLREFQTKKLESDNLIITNFRNLYDARSPDSNLVWTNQLELTDPSYSFRGYWRQLADRLNQISEFNLKNKLITSFYDLKSQQNLKDTANIAMEAIEKFFIQHGVLKIDNLIWMEDFKIFQEAVGRSIQLQTITPNQIYNFAQQMAYYDQCPRPREKFNMMTVYVGILLQTTMKRWGMNILCSCNAADRQYCEHSNQDAILKQHLPKLSKDDRQEFLLMLHNIADQTCDCDFHKTNIICGPSKMLKEPVPEYAAYKNQLSETRPEISEAEHKYLYQKAIVSWLNARLFLYITPYSVFDILSETRPSWIGQFDPYVREFSEGDRVYLERALMQMGINTQMKRIKKLEQLALLKKSYCLCRTHINQRIDKFLEAINLDVNNPRQRKMALEMFNILEQKFYVLMGSCTQKNGTCMTCQELLYEVTANQQGGFDVITLSSKPQHHTSECTPYINYNSWQIAYLCHMMYPFNREENIFLHMKKMHGKSYCVPNEITWEDVYGGDRHNDNYNDDSASYGSVPSLISNTADGVPSDLDELD